VDKLDAEEAKISITMFDKGFFKNAIIGQFDFDLSFIYNRKNHTMLHQWVALSNPKSEHYNEVTGYLKVSISVAATGDE